MPEKHPAPPVILRESHASLPPHQLKKHVAHVIKVIVIKVIVIKLRCRTAPPAGANYPAQAEYRTDCDLASSRLKSLTNRAFVLAALANGTTRLNGILRSDDTDHMQRCLRQLGIASTDIDATTVEVHGGRELLQAPSEPLFVGNSAQPFAS